MHKIKHNFIKHCYYQRFLLLTYAMLLSNILAPKFSNNISNNITTNLPPSLMFCPRTSRECPAACRIIIEIDSFITLANYRTSCSSPCYILIPKQFWYHNYGNAGSETGNELSSCAGNCFPLNACDRWHHPWWCDRSWRESWYSTQIWKRKWGQKRLK